MAEDDWDGWKLLTERARATRCSSSATICSSPTPSACRRASSEGVGNSILIKVNQIGTITETLEAIELARRNGYTSIISPPLAAKPKTPSSPTSRWPPAPARSRPARASRTDRIAKYNQLLRIEEELGQGRGVSRAAKQSSNAWGVERGTAAKNRHDVLTILDGWGYRAGDTSPTQSRWPASLTYDKLLAEYPNSLLHASDHFVGLPDGQMGNSEVGHLNIGSGRVVHMDITRIDDLIRSGEFFRHPVILAALKHAGERDAPCICWAWYPMEASTRSRSICTPCLKSQSNRGWSAS